MKKKRIAAIAASGLVAALALAGCSATTGTTTDEGDGSGTLTIFAIPNGKAALDELIPKFEDANPGIKVEVTYAEVDSMISTLRTQLSAGTAADVFSAWPGNGTPGSMENLVPGGFLMDLSDLAFSKNIPSGFDSVTEVDGKRYILPMSTGAIGAIYNVKAVEDAGAKVPTTWNEVLDFCDAAKAAGKTAFALGAQTLWNTQLIDYALTPTLVYGPNPNFDKDQAAGKESFSDSGWKDALEKNVEMLNRGCFQADPLGTPYEGATALVASGDAFAMVSVTSTFAAIGATAPEGTELSMFALPATNNAADTWMPAGASGGYGANAKAKNPVAAKKFMEFLGSDATMAEYAKISGQLPAIPTDLFEVPASLQVVVDHVKAGTIHPYIDQLWPNAKVQAAHFDAVQKVLGGTASISDVLKEMDAAYKG
jgi:raffinose/stachyose/melibiose transport system substrate-binding protein